MSRPLSLSGASRLYLHCHASAQRHRFLPLSSLRCGDCTDLTKGGEATAAVELILVVIVCLATSIPLPRSQTTTLRQRSAGRENNKRGNCSVNLRGYSSLRKTKGPAVITVS